VGPAFGPPNRAAGCTVGPDRGSQDVNELADERGQRILAEEIAWRLPEKLAAFAQWNSLADRALWAYLEAREAFDQAALFARAEALRNGQFAARWNSLSPSR